VYESRGVLILSWIACEYDRSVILSFFNFFKRKNDAPMLRKNLYIWSPWDPASSSPI